MRLSEWIKNNWRLVLIGTLLIANAIFQFKVIRTYLSQFFSISLINLIGVSFYVILDIWEKIKDKSEIKEVRIEPEQWEDIRQMKTSLVRSETNITQERVKVEEKKKDNRIIADLINENFISIKTLENNILDKKFISAFCYQVGFKYEISPKVKELMKNKEVDLTRKYPIIFDKIGFIKLARPSPFFIISEDNIFPEKFRNLNNLADYLIKKAKIILAEEWDYLKEVHKKKDKDYYLKIKDKLNPLNFNMLLMKINRRDMRHRYNIRNDFNREFVSELSSIVKLEKLNLLDAEKIEIKKLVLGSSINILILSINKQDRRKILELEDIFKKPIGDGGLGIQNFYDYHKTNKNKIKEILRKKFKDEKKVEEYASIIFNNSKDYEGDLKKIGIKI